jgi:hypothetical protein
MKTGFAIAAAVLMYFFPELWVETTIALGIGLLLFWWVPEPWTVSPSTGSAHFGHAVTEPDNHDWRSDSGVVINPATGLPMADALVDVAGNPFGTAAATSTAMGLAVNPMSGLPMADSQFDIAGNAFGTSSPDSHFE